MTFEFQAPAYLLLLLLLPLLGWRVIARSWGGRPSLRFSSLELFHGLRRSPTARLRRYLPLLRLLGLAFVIVALARPRFGIVEREIVREGVDLYYVIDVSASMNAVDFKPSRLERAKQITAQFIDKRRNNRQGIVVFSGESFVLCPLSFDGNTVKEFLKTIHNDTMGVQGTAIGMGLSRALKKLEDSEAESKVLILLTDGENNVGTITPRQAAEVAKAMGVRIYTIGIGSQGYVDVPVRTAFGVQYQRVRTEIDEKLLTEIARDTGGIYRRATNAEELEAVFDEIDRLEKTEIEMEDFRSYEERMLAFCWPALLLLLGELVLAHTRFLELP